MTNPTIINKFNYKLNKAIEDFKRDNNFHYFDEKLISMKFFFYKSLKNNYYSKIFKIKNEEFSYTIKYDENTKLLKLIQHKEKLILIK